MLIQIKKIDVNEKKYKKYKKKSRRLASSDGRG